MKKYNIESRGKWSLDYTEKYLSETTYPVRLATIGGDSYPLVVSLWFLYDDGLIWCAVQNDSVVAENISDNKRVAFEVAPNSTPYRGVRGQGFAKLVPGRGEEKLRKLIKRYLDNKNRDLSDWLLSRTETETAICIQPHWFYTWDFSDRME